MPTPPAPDTSMYHAAWTATAAIAKKATACAPHDPARSAALAHDVLAWCLAEMPALVPEDAWNMITELPLIVLQTALDSPRSPAGLLLEHARPSLARILWLHPQQHLLSADHLERLEGMGMTYGLIHARSLRTLWVHTGSVPAENLLKNTESSADHLAVWWRGHGLVAPERGFPARVAAIAERALAYRMPLPQRPIFGTFLHGALHATQVFDARVMVPLFALESPHQGPGGRDPSTTAFLLEGLSHTSASPAWRRLLLAISPDTRSAHHLLARRTLLDQLPTFTAILSMPRVPSTPEDLFALKRDLDAKANGHVPSAAGEASLTA